MQVTREDLNPCTILLTVHCEEAEVKDGFEKAFKQVAKRVRVPGFRPGTAPKAMVEGLINPMDLYDTAGDNIVRVAYKAALAQEALTPHSRPQVDLKSLDKESSKCEFTITVPLAPKVQLGEYKGLAAQRPAMEVTTEELDSQIDEMRRRRSSREPVTGRGVKEGDIAVVNIRVDGEDGEGKTFMTVAGNTFEQLDQGLMGMEVEQTKSLELTFPENFQEKEWAGQLLSCQVTLRSLSAVKLPELDDAFAQAFEQDSVEALRERVREQMLVAKRNMVQEYVSEQLLDDLLKRSDVHVPDTMWESVAARRMEEIARDQAERDVSIEQFAADNNMTVEELQAAQGAEAKVHVVRAVMVREIFAKEQMKLDNVELNDELIVMSREYQMEPKVLLAALKKNNALEELHFRAVYRKVLGFLTENASIEEVEQGA